MYYCTELNHQILPVQANYQFIILANLTTQTEGFDEK
jgi:hypothetical protein